ncbi:MAG: amidase family protein, partial [Dehalococcoidia bacterium]
MTGDDLRFASIATLARKLRDGDITVDQIVDKSLEVIGNLDSELNAFLEVWSDEVREKASEAQRSIEIEKSASPLTGIPIGLKDLVDVYGRTTTAGSKVLQGNVA